MPFEFNLPDEQEENHEFLATAITPAPTHAVVVGVEETFNAHLDGVRTYLDRAKGIMVADESEVDKMVQARTMRLEIRKVRIQIEKDRKEYKEDLLRKSQFIDRVAREIKIKLEEAENHLKLQEDYVKIKEEERKQARYRSRVDQLKELGLNDIGISPYNLMDIEDIQFDEILNQVKLNLAEKKRLEEEERNRIENEKKRQAEIEAENRRLRKEQRKKNEEARRLAEQVEDAKREVESAKREVEKARRQVEESAEHVPPVRNRVEGQSDAQRLEGYLKLITDAIPVLADQGVRVEVDKVVINSFIPKIKDIIKRLTNEKQ